MQHRVKLLFLIFVTILTSSLSAQNKDSIIVQQIMKEASENSQLQKMAHELFDVIGPRLVGTPQMKQAHDWAVNNYKTWGITARNEQWGEWRGWERGVTHIDLVSPRVRSLEGMMLAWSPGTQGKTVSGEAILIPDVADSIAFQKWLPAVKGKFVLISMLQPTGRPDDNWDQFGLKESIDKMKKDRTAQRERWDTLITKKIHMTAKDLALALENAGAIGLIQNNWSQGFGVDKIFGANTKKIPTVDISLEDYGLVYRLAEGGQKPTLSLRCDSKELGIVPTFNTIAEIKGTEKLN